MTRFREFPLLFPLARSPASISFVRGRVIIMAKPGAEFDAENPWVSKKPDRSGPRLTLVAPLIYGPMLPLIRITFRNQPVLRDR